MSSGRVLVGLVAGRRAAAAAGAAAGGRATAGLRAIGYVGTTPASRAMSVLASSPLPSSSSSSSSRRQHSRSRPNHSSSSGGGSQQQQYHHSPGLLLLDLDAASRRRRHAHPMGLQGVARRGFASIPDPITASSAAAAAAADAASSSASSSLLDGSLASKLLALSGTAEGAAAAGAEAAAQVLGNWPSDYAIRAIELLHEVSGMPYWLTIMSMTVAMRIILFPLVVQTARNAAKMTLMKPEMEAITERIKAAPMGDREAQKRYQKELYGLFDKYQCTPARSLVGPLGNIALFVPMFFGLRKMGECNIPGFDQGGIEWFVDLGAADPTYILPAAVTLGFLAVTEIGMDGVQMQVSPQMKFVFRILPVVFLPFTSQMPAGCLLYWGASNIFSVGQTLLMKNKQVKAYFGIPEIPQRLQQQQAEAANPFKKLLEEYEERKQSKAAADAEIMHGGKRPPPPPPSSPGGQQTFAKHPGLRATPPPKK